MPPEIRFRDVHTRQRDRTHPQRERTSQTRRRNTESDTTAAQQAVEDHVQDRAVRAVPMLCFRSAFPTCHAFAIPPVDLIDDGPSDAEVAARVSECRERFLFFPSERDDLRSADLERRSGQQQPTGECWVSGCRSVSVPDLPNDAISPKGVQPAFVEGAAGSTSADGSGVTTSSRSAPHRRL